MVDRPPIPRFDPAPAWDRLDPMVQRAVGLMALTLVIGEQSSETAGYEGPIARAAETAAGQARSEIQELLSESLPDEFGPDAPPLVPLILGEVCRGCGCSEEDGCPEGCFWAADKLCSVCAADGKGDDA